MLPISICMIAKNEEKYIGECLRRLSQFDWEIVVVDTGSIDHTVEIAKAYTPNVYHFDWVNDFSAARNYCISKAKNDYILTVDCDEYLDSTEDTYDILSALPTQFKHYQIGTINICNITDESAGIHERVARFFNRKYFCYQGSIHEQLVSNSDSQTAFVPIPLSFQHMGYRTMDIKKVKASRNIALLKKELTKAPNNPYILFQLGQSFFGIEDYENALPYFEKALSLDVNEQDDYVQTMVESYGYCLLYLKQYTKALELEGIYPIFSKRADFVFLMGLIYMNNALFECAINEFTKATTISAFSVDGVNSYKAFYNIGIIYECLGDRSNAIKHFKKCGNYPPALQRINK